MGKVRSILLSLLLVTVAGLALAACGSSDDDDGGSAASSGGTSTSAASGGNVEAPKSIQDKGFIDIEALDNYPPYTYADDSGKMQGIEVDMMDAIAAKMGVKPRWHNMKFEAMIPAIANRRNDLMVMGMADTADRRKTVDFLDLYKTGMYVMTRKGNPENLSSDNLCGRKIAVTTSSLQETVATDLAEECEKEGKPKLQIMAFQDNAQEYLAVTNGRADGDLVDGPNGAYFVKTNPKWELLPGLIPLGDVKYTGWIMAKGNTELRDALMQSIDALIKDGTWGEIVKEHGIEELALTPPLFNGAPVPAS